MPRAAQQAEGGGAAENAMQGVGVDVESGRQLLGRARAAGQQVGDPELRHSADDLGPGDPEALLEQYHLGRHEGVTGAV